MSWTAWVALIAVSGSLGACGDSAVTPDEDVSTSQSALMKGTAGAKVGDNNYCGTASTALCGLGEGNCTLSSQCQQGLFCVAGNLAKRGALTGNACAPQHCGDGVANSGETSIDCGGECGSDCAVRCDKPNGSDSRCSTDCPCSVGEGDCDSAAECQSGLVCGTSNGPAFGLPAGTDVCWASTCQNGTKDGNETAVDCGGSCAPCAPPAAGPVTLASGGVAALHIVIAPHADPNVHAAVVATANDLRDKLNAIVENTTFVVDPPTNTPSGISLGIDGDFPNTGWPYQGYFRPNDVLAGGVLRPERLALQEQYVLRTPQGSNRVIVAGATTTALQDAVWDLLAQAGYRHFFQTPTWEVIPHPPGHSLTMQLATDEKPAFLLRNLTLPGNLWESAFTNASNAQFSEWAKHNRLGGNAGLGVNTGYGAIVTYWQNLHGTTFPAELSTDPSKNQNQRQFCLTGSKNINGTTWTVESVVREWAQAQTTASLSLSPNVNISWASALVNGALNCNDINDATYSNVANRMAAILNAAADAQPTKAITATLRQDFTDAPTLALRQNVFVNISQSYPAATTFALENRLKNWSDPGFEAGVADYFEVSNDETPGQVQLSLQGMLDRATRFYQLGARRYTADINWGWGVSGPSWWTLAQVLWDADAPKAAQTYRNDFLTNAFGEAAPKLDKYFSVLEGHAQWSENLVGTMYGALHEAFLVPNISTAVQERLGDLAVYTRYLELNRKFWNRCSSSGGAAEEAELKELLKFAYATRDRRIFESRDAMFETSNAVATCSNCLATGCATTGAACVMSGWAVDCLTPSPPAGCTASNSTDLKSGTNPSLVELKTIVDNGATNLHVLPVGAVHSPPYSTDLVPFTSDVPENNALPSRVGDIYSVRPFYLYAQRPTASGPFGVHVRKFSAGEILAGRASLASSPGVSLGDRIFAGTDMEIDWTFDLSSALHRVDLDDRLGRMYTSFPAATRVAIPVGPNDPALPFNFRWSAYFVVPAGTTSVVGWSQTDGTVFRFSKATPTWQTTRYMSDFAFGNACTSPRIIGDASRSGALNDHFVIPVTPPATQDELWAFDDGNAGTIGDRVLLSVPPYLFRSPAEILVPREVAPETTNPTPCNATAACPTGQYCSQAGFCRTDGGGCTATSQCATAQSCQSGSCQCTTCSASCTCGTGGTCQTNNDCRPGLTCVEHTCQDTSHGGALGDPCNADVSCLSGLSCAAQQCVPSCQVYPNTPACIAARCANGVKDADESDVDCGGSCADCQPGKECSSNADCAVGLTCGENNGGYFNKARSKRVCWSTSACENGVDATECGQPNSICGQNCDGVLACDPTNPSCPAGESCRKGLASLFGSTAQAVCMDQELCPSDDHVHCGAHQSLCGKCVCTPSCASATCASPDDGCGGECPGVCDNAQTGCRTDFNCKPGLACLANPDGTSVCRPAACAFQSLKPPLCGSPGAECGAQCPVCVPQCAGRECGLDPNCGTVCGSDTCPAGGFCNDGHCASQALNLPPIFVSDPNGSDHLLEDLPQAPTVPAGALAGTFSVSDQGTSQYTIPIEVPPGRAGMQPALSLQYAGSRVNGYLGVGWHIEGLSVITRCSRIYALDGYAAPVKNDNTDRFCIDGKRLESVGEAVYGADGTEYRTIIDTFSRVVSYKESGTPIQNDPIVGVAKAQRDVQGPDYFIVWTKDGRKLTYGRSRDSLVSAYNDVRYSWLLKTVEDRSGNTMVVSYENFLATPGFTVREGAASFVRPKSIAYTGHNDQVGDRQVEFAYEGRGDIQLGFRQGGLGEATFLRLRSITTKVRGNAVKSYQLSYGEGALSQLKSIAECVGEDGACKPSTKFAYTPESGFTEGSDGKGLDEGAEFDANGDGVSDFFETDVEVGKVDAQPTLRKVALGVDTGIAIGGTFLGPAGSVASAIWWSMASDTFWGMFAKKPTVTFKDNLYLGTASRTAPPQQFTNVQGIPCTGEAPTYLFDYDQDGNDDVVRACSSGTIFVARSLGNGQFVQFPANGPALSTNSEGIRIEVPGGTGFHLPGPAPVFFDVNGDGLQDVLSCKDQYKLELRLRISPSGGFAPPIVKTYPPSDITTEEAQKGQTFCGEDRPTFSSFDVDGDGGPDLIVHDQQGWKLLRYTTYPDAIDWSPIEFPKVEYSAYGDGLRVADLNGDGLLDVSKTIDATSTLFVWLNSGRGFIGRMVPYPAAPSLSGSTFSLQRRAIIDYDADGRQDFVEHWGLDGATPSSDNRWVFSNQLFTQLTAQQATDLRSLLPVGVGHSEMLPVPFSKVGDIDGDGNPDLFGDYERVFYGSGARNMLLSRVEDGLGRVTRVDYDGANTYDHTCTGTTYPETCLRKLTGLVANERTGFIDDAGHETLERTTTFTYRNARLNMAGHGWLGFERRTVRESATGRTTTVDYEPPQRFDAFNRPTQATNYYTYPLAGMPRRVIVDDSGGWGDETPSLDSGKYDRRERVDNTWNVGSSTKGRPFPWLAGRTTNDYARPVTDPVNPLDLEINGTNRIHCDEDFQTDAYGNVKHAGKQCQREAMAEVAPDSEGTDTEYQTDELNWFISNPTHVHRYSRHESSSEVQDWDLTYDVLGRLHTVTRDPNGNWHTTTYTPNVFGNVEHVLETVANGTSRSTGIEYDQDQIFPYKITNAKGHVTQLHFNAFWGEVSAVVDPNGKVQVNAYDGFGRIGYAYDPSGSTTYEYSGGWLNPVSTDVGTIWPRFRVQMTRKGADGALFGGTVSKDFDYDGRLVATQTPGIDVPNVSSVPVRSEQVYDTAGRLTARTLPHAFGADVVPADHYTYDHLDRITEVEHSDSTFRTWQYGSVATLDSSNSHLLNGLYCWTSDKTRCAVDVATAVDEEGKGSAAVMDAYGRVVHTVDGDNITTGTKSSNFYYGAFSRLMRATDHAGFGPEFIYDAWGHVTTFKDPDVGDFTNTYNAYGELSVATDRVGSTRTYSYDPLGRIESIVDDAGLTEWHYDDGQNAIGQLVETVSPRGQHVAYRYEPLVPGHNRGLLKQVEYDLDDTSYVTELDYDDLGRTTTVAYPDTGSGSRITTRVSYDTKAGEPYKLEEIGGAAPRSLWQLNGAFSGVLPESETFGNNANTTYQYDPQRYWLENVHTSLGAQTAQNIDYEHWDNGQIQSRTTLSDYRYFVYDGVGRLLWQTESINGGQSTSTGNFYDDSGNLRQRADTNITFSPTQKHLAQTVGAATYHYDANGNLDSRVGTGVPGGAQTISYTPFSLPSGILTGAEAGTKATTFEYTADEQRVIRRDSSDGTSRYFVGGIYQRLAGSNDATLEERFQLSVGGRAVGEIIRAGGQEKTLYFHQDAIGSPETMTTTAGGVLHQEFDAWGATTNAPSPEATRAGFTGQQQDTDLGLIDMNGRLYDPLAGRFTTADPIMQAPFSSQGLNRYAYVFNDPVNLVDPSGFSATMGSVGGEGTVAGDISTGVLLGSSAAIIGYGGYGVASAVSWGSVFSSPTPAGAGLAFAEIGLRLYFGLPFGGSAGGAGKIVPSGAAPAFNPGAQGASNAVAQSAPVAPLVQQRPANLSLFAPERGAIAEGPSVQLGKIIVTGSGPSASAASPASTKAVPRLPDFLTGSFNFSIPTPWTGSLLGGSVSLSLDRVGHLYFGLGPAIGKSPLWYGGSFGGGWLNQMAKPSATNLNNFLTGHGLNFGGGEFGVGAFEQVSPSLVGTSSTAAATVVGAATSQIGGGYSYSWDIMSLGVSW